MGNVLKELPYITKVLMTATQVVDPLEGVIENEIWEIKALKERHAAEEVEQCQATLRKQQQRVRSLSSTLVGINAALSRNIIVSKKFRLILLEGWPARPPALTVHGSCLILWSKGLSEPSKTASLCLVKTSTLKESAADSQPLFRIGFYWEPRGESSLRHEIPDRDLYEIPETIDSWFMGLTSSEVLTQLVVRRLYRS